MSQNKDRSMLRRIALMRRAVESSGQIRANLLGKVDERDIQRLIEDGHLSREREAMTGTRISHTVYRVTPAGTLWYNANEYLSPKSVSSTFTVRMNQSTTIHNHSRKKRTARTNRQARASDRKEYAVVRGIAEALMKRAMPDVANLFRPPNNAHVLDTGWLNVEAICATSLYKLYRAATVATPNDPGSKVDVADIGNTRCHAINFVPTIVWRHYVPDPMCDRFNMVVLEHPDGGAAIGLFMTSSDPIDYVADANKEARFWRVVMISAAEHVPFFMMMEIR